MENRQAVVSQALIDARRVGAWAVVAGLTVVGRIVRAVELEGVKRITVVSDRDVSEAEIGPRGADTEVHVVQLETAIPLAGAIALDPIGDLVVCVAGNLVVDPRLMALLVSAQEPTLVCPIPGEANRIELATLPPDRIGVLGRPVAEGRPAIQISPARLPTFSEEMRGETPILLRRVTDAETARDATRAVVRAAQKHVMDAPARLIDPFFENAIVTWLAPTRVTPNHVTYACSCLGMAAAVVLVKGVFWLAFPLMYAVEWLDGVDGKLARVRLEYSTIGQWESYFDFVYENAWWVALTVWFHGAGDPARALWAGAALIGGNLLDEVAYTLAHLWLGTTLDLLSKWDRAFRFIAGRRNVYVAILLIATVCGRPLDGFAVVGGWAVLTGFVHAVRLGVAVFARCRGRVLRRGFMNNPG